jgi:cation transport regulator ChaB
MAKSSKKGKKDGGKKSSREKSKAKAGSRRASTRKAEARKAAAKKASKAQKSGKARKASKKKSNKAENNRPARKRSSGRKSGASGKRGRELAGSKVGKSGKAKKEELPSTLQRSDEKAQQTFAEAHDAALGQYESEEAAHRVAFAAVKHTHEKVGDHWEPKQEWGPSDKQSAKGSVDTDYPTAGGVDANATRAHLYELATRLKVPGRSRMSKAELVDALQKANDKASAQALN